MNEGNERSYQLPHSQSNQKIAIIIVVGNFLVAVLHGRDFFVEPELRSGGLFLLFSVTTVFWAWNHYFVRRLLPTIFVVGEEIFLEVYGKRKTRHREAVETVTDDLIEFHLFTKKQSFSLPKTKVPEELTALLASRVESEK